MNIVNLPKDIVNLILEFDGRIKYRKGKYLNCISKSDYRYTLLSKLQIPSPVKYTMENDCSHFEHFEYDVNLNNKYKLCVWNVIYNPPNKIQYFCYKVDDSKVWYRWVRE